MYKISDFDYLKKEVKYSYKRDFSFYAVAASEDCYDEPMIFYLLDIKYLEVLEKHKNNIAGIICTKEIDKLINKTYNTIVTSEPKTLFFLIHNNLKNEEKVPTIIEEGCTISDKAYIAPYNVIIKSGTIIEEFVSVKENVEIGHNCFLSAGCKIGTEGFNIFQKDGMNVLVKHRGKVILGDGVVILSNSCVAKAIYGHINTVLENGVMLDNLVHVGHDSKLRKNAELASGAVICGFGEIGEGAFMGVNSSIKQLLRVGNNTKVGMGAMVNFNTDDNDIIAGPEPKPLNDAKIMKHYNQKILEELKENNN